jgi:hypothetical protein
MVMGFQSQHTNVGCLAGFVWSQVTPGLSMSMRIRPICKSLHAYIHFQILHVSSVTLGRNHQSSYLYLFTPHPAL